MAVVADTQHAVDILHGIQGRLEDSGDVGLSQQVAVMVKLLDSPSFKQLLNLQQAVKQLKEHINTSPPGAETEFDFSHEGELVLPHQEPEPEPSPVDLPEEESHPFAFENVTFEHDEDIISPSVAAVAASAPVSSGALVVTDGPSRRISLNDERLEDMAFNRELVAVDLVKPENAGLGFTVVGLNSKSHGDLGIFIQKIQPNTVAARDGRLHDSDQILAINDNLLHAGISHKDAIGMLHQIKGDVHLIIARGDFDLPPPSELKTAEQGGKDEVAVKDESGDESADDLEAPADILTIDLLNDGGGLGFGIVGVHNTGIVVKTIVPGGVADRDGRLESGDIILQIGDISLEGMNSTKVAGVLRESGNHVRLTVIKKGIRVPRPPQRAAPTQEPLLIKLEEPKVESAPPTSMTSPPPDVAVDAPTIELEYFELDLQKTSQGLGLSIAGFEENRPDGVEAGIFVKGIAAGSPADLCQKISVGDQILEVDGQSVNGYGNRQAVELLRRTGSVVHMKLARRKRKSISENGSLSNGAPEPLVVPLPVIDSDDRANVPEVKTVEDSRDVEATVEEERDVRVEATAAAAIVMAAAPTREPEPVEPVREEPAREEPPAVEPAPPVQPLAAGLTYPSSDPSYVGMVSRNDPVVQKALWRSMLGPTVDILVSEVEKKDSLGIVLEGRVDIDENGQEIQPRHYISTVVSDGPVGRQGLLIPGDELLEVNGIRLYGRDHRDVVGILRSLPSKVHLICGRHDDPPVVIDGDLPIRPVRDEVVEQAHAPEVQSRPPGVPSIDLPQEDERDSGSSTLVSGDTVSVHSETPSAVSHDSLMGVSVWSDQVQTVTLVKGDRGLGFSILDYQDPLKPDSNVILIRSLVEGGIAERDGRLIPGDRLMSVNDTNLENATLEAAVEAVRNAPKGQVRIGIAKPLPSAIIEEQREAVRGIPRGQRKSGVSKPSTSADDQKQKEALAQQAIEVEKRRSLDRDAPIVAVSASLAHGAPPTKTNPPDLIAYEPPKPAPRKSLETSPPPEPSRPPPSPPVTKFAASASLTIRPEYVELPESLERTMVLREKTTGMGMTVIADQANGAIIKSIIRGGCVQEDGTLSVGDYITAVNGDSTRNMSNADIRGLLRKCFFGGSEISLSYILASDADAYRKQLLLGQGNSDDDDDDEIWEDIRVVEVYRETGRSLGISILGGRVGQGLLEGIFIKHVLEDSPAGQTGELKTGDRILEVNDCDLRDATHDQAVAIIKNAPNPVKFKVQSLTPELQPAYLSEMDDQPYQATLIMSMDEDKSDSDEDDVNTRDTLSESSGHDSEVEDEYGYTNKIIRERYDELPGDFLILEVTKVGKSLGLSLAGNKDPKVLSVFVVGIHPDSPAAIEGSTMIADELMEINGIRVYGHSHREASMIIGDLPEGPVKLVIRRRQEAVDELSVSYVKDTPDSQVPSALKKPEAGVVLDLTDGGGLDEESGEIDFSKFPNVHNITLNKGATGLGFFILEKKDQNGNPGIFVKEISHGGAAGKEGSLQIDDQVLAVDDLPVVGLTKLSAISVLKATRGRVELTVSSVKLHTSNPYLDVSQGEDVPDGGIPGEPVIGSSTTSDVHSKPPDDDNSDLDSGPLAAPILQKAQTSIIIDRGSRDLGLKIAGGSDTDIPIIIIDEVYVRGAAARDGRLKPGDQLLAVNGVQLSDVTHAEAIQVLKDVPALVPMIVFRVESDATSSETWEEVIVELPKKEGQGLGLSIVGRKNDQGVFISDIVVGGAASRDGRLCRGDRIISIDGNDVVNARKDVVAPMLRNSSGTVRLKVGRLTAETVEPIQAPPPPEETDETNPPKEESLMSELMNDPQLDPAGGESGYSQDEEQEEIIDPGAPIETVILERGPDGLGFSIVGGAGSPHGDLPIYIKTVFDRGAAIESGALKRGDQIVEVNDRDLRGANHMEAVSILKQVRGQVKLKIISR